LCCMKGDKQYLEHILGAIVDINEFIKGISKQEFFSSKEKQYSVFRAFEIIGEASRKISSEFKKGHDELPWKKMMAMRDKLIHDYFQVSMEIVWETIKNDLPLLKKQLEQLLDD
jgi:uncharacterized protein with HEPN domain